MAVTPRQRALGLAGLGAALLLACGGCATPLGSGPTSYDYFARPTPHDAWSPKIAGWQSREQATPDREALAGPASVSGGEPSRPADADRAGDLRARYFAYRAEQKREMARELTRWIQDRARDHYVPDGPIDHWATLEETLQKGGDDCDGLELLVYHFLRDLGFGEDEVYRAIVYRPSDGQHHMVTLWFERPDDPWVLDPTGAMTTDMVRMSEAAAWVPLKVFSETEEYTVAANGNAGASYASLPTSR